MSVKSMTGVDETGVDHAAGSQARTLRWLIPLAGLATLVGYFGPWIDHAAAGLVVTGLDLAEYIKFLPSIRDGTLSIWRQGFYLPLLAVSLISSLYAFRQESGYGWPMRIALLLMAAVAALNMLPPAWTPHLLLTPEFRLQTAAIGLCLGVAAFSPFIALLPRQLAGAITLILAVPAIWLPVQNFLRVLPDISTVYNQAQHPAWGMYVMIAGLVGFLGGGVVELWGGGVLGWWKSYAPPPHNPNTSSPPRAGGGFFGQFRGDFGWEGRTTICIPSIGVHHGRRIPDAIHNPAHAPRIGDDQHSRALLRCITLQVVQGDACGAHAGGIQPKTDASQVQHLQQRKIGGEGLLEGRPEFGKTAKDIGAQCLVAQRPEELPLTLSAVDIART